MKQLYSIKNVLPLLFIGFIMIGCDEDAVVIPEPKADFTLVVEGKSITSTNTSTDAETYSWDFGDGTTADTEAASHTYEANGSYVVKLTVTNTSGEDSKQEALEIINITIDGNFDDWADVPALENTGSGSFTTIKMDNLDNKLFVYIKTTDAGTSFLDLFMDLDYDVSGTSDTTGYLAAGFAGNKFGADLLFEGFFAETEARATYGMFYGLFNADAGTDFGARAEPVLDPNMIKFTDFATVDGGKAYEFSIDFAFLPASSPLSETIQIFIDEWNHNTEATGWWATFSGHYPEKGVTDENDVVIGLPATYTFK